MQDADNAEDYRRSHLEKGTDYDAALATSPFDRYMARQEAKIAIALVDRLFPGGVPRYLDFACGTGRIISLLESRAERAYGVDVSPTMLAEAKQKCRKAELIERDITRDEFTLGDFDLVTSFRFFGNAQDQLRTDVLAALFRAVKPGGYLLINNHRNSGSIRHRLLRATRQATDGGLDHSKLIGMIRAAGFQIAETHGVGAWVFRASMKNSRVLESRRAEWYERLTNGSLIAPVAPDNLILARKPGGTGR